MMALQDSSLVEQVSSTLGRKAKQYVFEDKLLGRRGGDSLSGEFFPLPKSLDTIVPYDHIWESETAYHREVIPDRRKLLMDALEESDGVECIVSYGKIDTNPCPKVLLNQYSSEKIETLVSCDHTIPYTLYRLTIGDNSVYLIHAPFFGMGRASYSDVAEAAVLFRQVTESDG